GAAGIYYYEHQFSTDHRIAELQQQKHELEEVVKRLEGVRRVAKVLVTDQWVENGVQKTKLLWVEYGRDGQSTLDAKEFVIDGNEAHFDALLIKFSDGFLEKGDALRGQSIALFTRVYGRNQSPADGFPIDEPGHIPDVYKVADPAVYAFEQDLWNNFWRLYDDPNYRHEKGVDIATGQSPWGTFSPGYVYKIEVGTLGGVSIAAEPLDPIIYEALKRHEAK